MELGNRNDFIIMKDKIQVSSCSQSAMHKKVKAAILDYVTSWGTNGHDWEMWMEICEQARIKFAKLINASINEVAIVTSVSHGSSAIANSLPRLNGKNNIVLTEMDFPCIGHVWLSQEGYEVLFVSAKDGEIPIDHYEKLITSKTFMVSIPHISYYNGFKQNIKEIAKIAHKNGSYVFIDAYQSAGQVPIDVKEMDIDFLVAGMQKYLLGIPGIAFLYVRKEIADQLTPKITGWFGQSNPFDFNVKKVEYAASARRFDSGTYPMLNGYAANAALDILLNIGIDKIEMYLKELSEFAIKYALEQELIIKSPLTIDNKGSNTAIYVSEAGKVEKLMKNYGIIAAARKEVIRIAPHYYNTKEDLKKAIDCIKYILSGEK
ncbi:MAG: aminotransferase class V-fold PLP-dependent enzyme [Clostridia bacterium]|nr:aminotransferase class V-fold PLP-dependent enzyme [Clostridia bacterium]